MTTCVALLRAVNVSGKNKIDMAQLRALFESLGHGAVSTYIQSGNVVFTSPTDDATALAGTVEQRIEHDFGVRVVVIIRTAVELAGVVADNPFVVTATDPSKLHVTFLADPAGSSVTSARDAVIAGPDELAVGRREIYLHCPGGYGRTKLTNAWFEKITGVAATTRNWNTVTRLLELTCR